MINGETRKRERRERGRVAEASGHKSSQVSLPEVPCLPSSKQSAGDIDGKQARTGKCGGRKIKGKGNKLPSEGATATWTSEFACGEEGLIVFLPSRMILGDHSFRRRGRTPSG